ncbi:MAG: hydroxyacylglutathione hydrolase [Rhodobacteraceae bacterium]|nr:hydroxyacylglutathione hydrolase [Paracoccaceae bacterium]
MPLVIEVVPCRTDNHGFLAHDAGTGATAAIDAPEAGPLIDRLRLRGWQLSDVLLTHHHGDHVEGVAELRAAFRGLRVTGHAADAHRLPPLDRAVGPGDAVQIGSVSGEVIDVSGHTLGHIAYHFGAADAAFTGDSLMALGCGRLFEGTAPEMWASLTRLMALPDTTRVYSGHDYIAGNAAFAESVEPANPHLAARIDAARRAPEGVHVTLGEERAANPFLRAGLPAMKAALGMEGATDEDVFAELRRRKDRF